MAFAVLVVGTGFIDRDVRFRDVVALGFFVAVVAAVAGLGSFFTTRAAVERVEAAAHAAQEYLQDHVFDTIARLPTEPSLAEDAAPFSLVGRENVALLERSAHAVWAYAIDLRWDVAQENFAAIIHQNLKDGKQYHYLIPNSLGVLSAVEELVYHNRHVPELTSLLEVRRRLENVPFAPHAITIYNPQFFNDHPGWPDPVVVMFSNHDRQDAGFLRLGGAFVEDYQRGFHELWQGADPVDIEVILAKFKDEQ